MAVWENYLQINQKVSILEYNLTFLNIKLGSFQVIDNKEVG